VRPYGRPAHRPRPAPHQAPAEHRTHERPDRVRNRLKHWRGIVTRYDKTAESYQADVTLASRLMWG
jgi:hypothetical protein